VRHAQRRFPGIELPWNELTDASWNTNGGSRAAPRTRGRELEAAWALLVAAYKRNRDLWDMPVKLVAGQPASEAMSCWVCKVGRKPFTRESGN
jgi:hypothetical protein